LGSDNRIIGECRRNHTLLLICGSAEISTGSLPAVDGIWLAPLWQLGIENIRADNAGKGKT
ncbi:MAG: hypothetical protein V3T65_03870, partial [Acidobacteriota bacterium]